MTQTPHTICRCLYYFSFMQYRDYYESRLDTVKTYIEDNRIDKFKAIFKIITKKPLAERAGIKYQRFLYLIKKPGSMTCAEIDSIARSIKVDYLLMETLIENQLAEYKRHKQVDHLLSSLLSSSSKGS
ncbi:MAG TPA: hypothetical protein VGM30_24905 [Puia sp.]